MGKAKVAICDTPAFKEEFGASYLMRKIRFKELKP